MPLAAVMIDIEGTAAPMAFVHDVLFPYARERLARFCNDPANDAVIAQVLQLQPGAPAQETLRGWMDRDEKITVLKTIQGMIWAAGYGSGEIVADIYADVPAALRRWARAGLKLFVYSSGSVAAQRLLFGHTQAGDLSRLFAGFFDTQAGPKRAMASYAGICRGANITASECLFLSDVEAELDAAAAAGLQTCQLVRAADGTVATSRHPVAVDFTEVASRFGLPAGA